MKDTKRITALLLAALISAGAFASCSSDAPDSGAKDTTPSGETTAAETVTADKTDSLDAFLAEYSGTNYGGEDFSIATSNIVNSALVIQQAPYETETGDRVNDALYKRDNMIEDSFGTNIVYTLIEPDEKFELQAQVSKTISSGDDIYDLAFGNMMVYAKNFIVNKHIIDLAAIDEIDLSAPWWHQTANRDLTVDGKMFLATGDITPRYIYSTFVMLFNQKLFKDNNIEFPYQAVNDGKWTIDMLLGMVKGTAQDLDNDGKIKGVDDYYGFTNEGWAYPLFNGFGETVVDISSGEVVITAEKESVYNKAMKIAELFELEDTFFKNEKTQYDSLHIFEDNRALFSTQTASNLVLLNEMESDYGVLPLPKYDEAQAQYHSFVNGYCATAIMIPITVADTSRVGTLTEAMAAISRFMVTPEAYEVTLLTRQTRDEESVAMLKLAAEGAMYDLNEYFDWGGLKGAYNNAMLNGADKLVSQVAKLKDKAVTAANEAIELFKEMK